MKERKKVKEVFSVSENYIGTLKKASNLLMFVLWILLILVCLYYKDRITVEWILNISPGDRMRAVFLLLLLFAVKSVSVVLYGGILYAVSGLLFPLPLAVAVNMTGTVIMVAIPYLIGKKAGSKALEWIVGKHSKLEILHSISGKNGFWISLFARIVGMLPSDLVGMYFGASGVNFVQYLAGSAAGLFPAALAFAVMGMSIEDVTSPEFLISAGFEAALTLISVISYLVWKKTKKKQ